MLACSRCNRRPRSIRNRWPIPVKSAPDGFGERRGGARVSLMRRCSARTPQASGSGFPRTDAGDDAVRLAVQRQREKSVFAPKRTWYYFGDTARSETPWPPHHSSFLKTSNNLPLQPPSCVASVRTPSWWRLFAQWRRRRNVEPGLLLRRSSPKQKHFVPVKLMWHPRSTSIWRSGSGVARFRCQRLNLGANNLLRAGSVRSGTAYRLFAGSGCSAGSTSCRPHH